MSIELFRKNTLIFCIKIRIEMKQRKMFCIILESKTVSFSIDFNHTLCIYLGSIYLAYYYSCEFTSNFHLYIFFLIPGIKKS